MAKPTVIRKQSGNNVKDGDRLTPAEKLDSYQKWQSNSVSKKLFTEILKEKQKKCR